VEAHSRATVSGPDVLAAGYLSGTALVVDDDPGMRSVLPESLAECG
jgi:hypothetical protein